MTLCTEHPRVLGCVYVGSWRILSINSSLFRFEANLNPAHAQVRAKRLRREHGAFQKYTAAVGATVATLAKEEEDGVGPAAAALQEEKEKQ